jgi:hypothetical protein
LIDRALAVKLLHSFANTVHNYLLDPYSRFSQVCSRGRGAGLVAFHQSFNQ